MQLVADLVILKQESASLVYVTITAALFLLPESGLEQEGFLITLPRVETRQSTKQIMEKNTSKPWDTSWSSDKKRKTERSVIIYISSTIFDIMFGTPSLFFD